MSVVFADRFQSVDFSDDILALRLLGSEMEREPWKQTSLGYIELVEERFAEITERLNALEESTVSQWFYNTLNNMPKSIVRIWDEWVVRTETTLPPVKVDARFPDRWLVQANY